MKKEKFTILCLFILFFSIRSCQKYKQTADDASGNNYIAGIAYTYNDFSADGLLKPLTNAVIKIAYTQDRSLPNYINSVKTDSSGGFIFSNLKDGVSYTIFAQDSISGVEFYGSIINTLVNDQHPIDSASLILYVDSIHQNGFIYTATDSLGNILSGVNVWVFSSPLLEDSSFAVDSCYGCLFNLTTNYFGKVSEFNIAPENYKTIFFAKYDNITFKGLDSNLVIPDFGIVRRQIMLKQ